MVEPREDGMGEPATEIVELDYSELAHPYYELQILQADSEEFRLPFLRSTIPLDEENAGFPGGSPWTALLDGDQVRLVHKEGSNGELVLSVGQSATIENATIFLTDVRQPPIGTLVGISAPYNGRVWSLGQRQTWLGRKGKRINHIELAHPTVSRNHATFWPESNGQVILWAEASGPPTTLNGKEIPAGQKARLSHGDLLGFGALLFRFQTLADPSSGDACLSVCTLGSFSVFLGGKDFAPEIRNEKARWLLAALAVKWGEARSVEWLLGQFWPDSSTSRARKNLGYTLGQIRDALGLEEENFESLVLRNQNSVGLNPDRLDSHDYMEVHRLTTGGQPLPSRTALDRLLALYQGPFLADCPEEWAETARLSLEKAVVRSLLSSARTFAEVHDLEAVELSFDKALEIDPVREEGAQVMMEAALAAGKPERAVAAYQKVERALKLYDAEPSTDLVKLYYRANLGL